MDCGKNFGGIFSDGMGRRTAAIAGALSWTRPPAQLSAGMKVKFSLALALSHRAELLILDVNSSMN